MIDGVVLFFSPGRKIAHIWCVLNEVPLCVAYREDFPKLWSELQEGSRVQSRVKPFGDLMRAFDLKLWALRPAGGA